MRPEDVEKLLAGYAAGVLNEQERRALMLAALERQELFDALVEEDALKELLEDPRCRRQLLELLGAPSHPPWRRAWNWIRRPAGVAALASAAAALVLVSAFVLEVARREPAVPLAAPAPPAPPTVAPAPLARVAPPETAATGVVPARPPALPAGPASAPPGVKAAAPPPAVPEPATAEKSAAVAEEKLGALPLAAALRDAGETAQPATLRCRLLRNGVEVAPGEELTTRDELVLRVESTLAGQVGVYRRTGEGALQVLAVVGVEGRPIRPGESLDIPLPAREQAGDEHLIVVLTPETAPPAYRTGLHQPGVRMAETPVPLRPLATVPLTLRFR